MSLQFNDTSTYRGLIQGVEDTLGYPDGYISGDTTRLKKWTARLNLAFDSVVSLILRADGKWQFDDSNHTTYPILTGNLVANQRDYSFTADSDSNLVLDIKRVFVKPTSTGVYSEIFPVDVQSDEESVISGFVDGQNTTGAPYTYDKTATGIFLDPIPSVSVTSGLKVYVNREASYFLYTDTTKKPGFYGLYHEYLILEACYKVARGENLANREALKRDLTEMKKEVEEAYSMRAGDERLVMTGEPIIYE